MPEVSLGNLTAAQIQRLNAFLDRRITESGLTGQQKLRLFIQQNVLDDEASQELDTETTRIINSKRGETRW